MLAITLAVATLSCGTCPPVPSVTSLSPANTTAGSSQFLLTVNGDDFRHDAVVNWNGSFVVTTFVSSHQLFAVISVADIAQPETVLVFVFNPPGGRHDLLLGWERSDVHNLVRREKIKHRVLHGQPVIV